MIARRNLLSAALLIGLLASQTTFAQDGWSLARQADGIRVYVRNVDGSPLREFRGEVQIRATPDDVVKVLRDADAYRQWMPDVAASELLKATDTEQFHYLDNKAPWPVSNRDGIYHFTYTKAGDGAVTVRVEAVPDYLPLREGKVRIPQAKGQWKLVPDAEGVKVTYQMHASPGGAIPDWLANRTVVDTPYGTLKALRSRVQEAGR
ncbi:MULTISPECIES: START domain-containing protein [unclassified Burkholderia]|uniref:START domain-containing protein n=1 Tax=unclassified Burkholderia TaxID=2613784 RepID=UPI0005CEA0B2|nr:MULTISPECIES: START domain-containing protein [unclassified Burkholderia]RQR35150.1 START domain protein [Burkholderia sp. Bp9131]RQR69047.1 START domain protein [Burkholderia sp. Bp9015]RQR78989.1 START domain protein [Burkholderia sp. Bp9011]RQR89186.1 START domain protein [Burkholderia sp. Bp9010]RQS04316.1 START domain protein [Burkholderia sp. Bp8991]